MPLSRHSVGTYQETSSHATRQGTLSHSRFSSLSHCGLILAFKGWNECARANFHFEKKKKAQAGNELWNFLPKILALEEKATIIIISSS